MIRKPFFTVDGVDGVGKSSAIQLAKKLRPELFVPFKCPPDELNQFRGVFDAREVHLGARFSFYAAADFYLSPKIRKVCETDPVCCDRFVLSTVAYHNVLGRRDGYTFTDFSKHLLRTGFLPHTTIVLIANEEARCARLAGRDQTQNTHRDVNTQLTSAVQTEF